MSDMTEAPHEGVADAPKVEQPLVTLIIRMYAPKPGEPGTRCSFEGPIDNPLYCYRAMAAAMQVMELMNLAQRPK